jgi:hypothetical protein
LKECPVKTTGVMLPLLAAIVLSASMLQVEGIYYSYKLCIQLPAGTEQYKANVSLSKPLQQLKVKGGEATFIRDDGLYLEITGSDLDANNNACIQVSGTHIGDPPHTTIHVTPVPASKLVRTREIRSMRVRRAQQIWHAGSFSVTTNKNTLLASFQPYHHQWGDDSLSGSTKHSSSGALVVHYAKGSYSQVHDTRGVGWFTTPNGLPGNADDLVLKYDIYFENFGWGKMGKLPGLYGGVSGEGAYLCSGGNNPSSCFSLRLMWREGGAGELYAYIPSNQASGFNDRDDVIGNSDYGQSIGRGKIHFQAGVWQTVTEQVHLNTVGKTDGWVKFCNQVSGGSQQCYTASNLRMRNNGDYHLRGLFFSTFFGGSQPDDAAPNDCHTYYKELSISVPDDVVVG